MEKKGLIMVPLIMSASSYGLYERVEKRLEEKDYRIFDYVEIIGDKAAGIQVDFLHDAIMREKDKINLVLLDLRYETKSSSGKRLRDAGYGGFIVLHDLDGLRWGSESKCIELLKKSGDDILVEEMRDLHNIVTGLFSGGINLAQKMVGSIVYNPNRFKVEEKVIIPQYSSQ